MEGDDWMAALRPDHLLQLLAQAQQGTAAKKCGRRRLRQREFKSKK
jgi:hypothetical protein